MNTNRLSPARLGRWLVVAGLAMTSMASAQVTNWVAYNEHRPFTVPLVPPSWGYTAPNVTGLEMGIGTSSGNLIDFLTGDPLAATVTFAPGGSPNDFGAITRPLATNTPMGEIFYGICDLANDGIVGVDTTDTTKSTVTITFNNLNPAKRYQFRGSSARNGGYAPRWTIATITAAGWVDAHLNGTGPGVITSNQFPANLGAGQAAWNSGHNAQGAVVGWDDIAPLPDGSFSILQEQYVGPTPGGGAALIASYGYAFGALRLAEVESVAPTITANPPALTSVEQNRPFSLSVAASGTPLLYQWYKEGTGEIPGATFPTYTVSQAALGDSGDYYAVVYNSLDRATSTVAQVTVFADTTAPSIATAFTYPTVDPSGTVATLDQIIVEFNEPVTPASVSSPASYIVPGGGNPVSVIVTNDRTVVLMLAAPLAEDTDYSVTASGMVDVVGNTAGAVPASFHSWASGLGNGLAFEAFNAGPGVEVTTLTSSPSYPDNPFLRANLRIFDTRVIVPDDTLGEFGTRVRGVFIPPVSGNWVFFLRTFDRGVVYLNPNGLDPAGAQEILRESTGNNPRNWDKFTSSAFALRAGQGYYVESLQKSDVTGTDVIKVAARLAGTGFPTPVDTLDTEIDPNSLAGAAIAFPLAPRDLGGPLTIQQDLVNVTAEENNLTTFSLQLDNPSLLPLQYQWFRDGNPITGANGPTYTIQPTIAADNGATFSVQVAKVGSSVTSGTATLTVVPDVTPPRVLEVISNPTDLTSLTVRFSELIPPAEAMDSFNFNLDPFSINDPTTLEPDGSTVTLTLLTPLTLGNSYQLAISGIHDLTGVNLLDPSPTLIQFTAGGDLPRLSIALSGNNAELSWPAPSTGFVLEQADAIVEPVSSIVWTPVSGTPQVVNGRNTLSVAAGPGNKIFRLRQ